MAWVFVLAAAAAAGVAWWWLRQRRALRAPVAPPHVSGGARPLARSSGGHGVDTRLLLDAFRSDEQPVPADAEREDRTMLIRLLQLVAHQAGADEAVLWEPHEEDGGHLLASAWSRGVEPPALDSSARLLMELAASEQRTTFNPDGAALRIAAVGVTVNQGRGAVTLHFREAPALPRTTILDALERCALEVASRHELLRTRASLARSNKRLRSMIRAATTFQASRDSLGLEAMLVDHAGAVTGATWCALVRGNREREVPTVVRTSSTVDGEFHPFPQHSTARRGTVVGDVFATGDAKIIGDTRPLISAKDSVFDDTTLSNRVRAFAAVPIRRSANDQVIGVLVLGHEERNGIGQADAYAANDLSTIAAGALDTAWAYADANERAKTDQLTGLPNRRAFDEEFARMISETDRYGGSAALVIVDVDHFKKVNDTYGHDAGDHVLKRVGAALSAERRGTDRLSRLGGEELALLLFQTDREGAIGVAERCRQAIADMAVRTSIGVIQVTASFGVAMYTARSGGAGALFDRADQALYQAKHGGRNLVVVAEP
ncbi:MAG: GGDEF domain-containing protein [Gemmatimonadaceae bacterium]|nr:GGDEF domain-containing protein [Gemmatimonadaceae bacterium]